MFFFFLFFFFISQYPRNLIFIRGIESSFRAPVNLQGDQLDFSRRSGGENRPMENALYLLYLSPAVRSDRFILHIEKSGWARFVCACRSTKRRPFARLVYNTRGGGRGGREVMNFSRARIAFSTDNVRSNISILLFHLPILPPSLNYAPLFTILLFFLFPFPIPPRR